MNDFPNPFRPPPTADVSRRALLLGGISAGAAVLAACSSGTRAARPAGSVSAVNSPTPTATGSAPATPGAAASATGSAPASSVAATSTSPATGRPVTVSSYLGDGALVGVGMPVVLSFEPAPTDSTAFVKAARVTVDGTAVQGAWYWEKPYADQPVQAHFRMRDYWPANSTVKVDLPIGGLSAGRGLVYRGALESLTFRTGDKRVIRVDGAKKTAVVEVNGKHHRTMKASLSKSKTPTQTGTKLVMQKGEFVPGTRRLRPDGAVRMQDTAHSYDLMVDWSVRITSSGEYLHAAPWNSEIGQTSTSDGCTNLSVADAMWFYGFTRIGDVVIHERAGGKPVPVWDGFGDWNVPWAVWQRGGLLKAA